MATTPQHSRHPHVPTLRELRERRARLESSEAMPNPMEVLDQELRARGFTVGQLGLLGEALTATKTTICHQVPTRLG